MVEKFVKEIAHKQLRSLRCSSSDSRNLLLKMFVAASDLQRGGHCSGRNGRNITRFLVGSTVFPDRRDLWVDLSNALPRPKTRFRADGSSELVSRSPHGQLHGSLTDWDCPEVRGHDRHEVGNVPRKESIELMD